MVRTFTGGRPLRNEMDEQEDAQPEQFQVPTGTRQRPSRPHNSQHERPERSTEPARTTELEERTRVLEMAMGKILARLIPDDPLIPLLNRDAQPAAVVATRNSPALSNIIVPTRPRGSGKLNIESSSSKHSEELMRKNADLERQLQDVQKSIDELKSPRSHQQTLDLDSAPLNLSITAEPYQEGFKIPHLETYDGLGDPDEHLHTYQAIMRIQNANDAMMCKVFPATLKSTARRWYHKLPRHSIDSYSQLAKLFSNKFASHREIKRTATELIQVHQKEGESLRDYMQRFNKATLEIDNVPDTICLSALLHSLKRGRFLDDLLENPPKTWNEVNDRSQILAQIQHWIRRPPPPLHDSPRADKSKHCDYHRVYGHNTEDCQHLKDELEFLARTGKLEGYVQKPHTQQTAQTHFVQGYDRPQGQRYQLGNTQDMYQDNQYLSEQGRAYRGRQFNRRGQGQRPAAQSQKDRRGVGCSAIPPPSGTINMISGAEWEAAAITFSPADYKRANGEPDVVMPHADPFVATVHIGNHNVNKKYEGPIYGFDNQLVPVEGVITLPIYVGSEPRFRMTSVSFLVVKMESAFNAILGRATLCELKAVISQPHLCMKFPTPQGVGVLKGNQRMARAYYQDTFKKVELAVAPRGSENSKPTQLGQQTMSISDIEHRPEGVKQKAEPVELVETVSLNPDVPERVVKIGTKLTGEEQAKLLEFLKNNQDMFAWTTDEMPGIPAELAVHKLSTDPTKSPVVQKHRLFGLEKQAAIDEEIQKLLQAGFIRRVEYSEWVSNPVLVKKPNGKWRMCIDFTNLNDGVQKTLIPCQTSRSYHQVQLLLDDQEKTAFYAGDAIYCYVMMPFGLKNAGATYQKLVQIIFKLQISRNIEVYVDDMIVTSVRAEDHIDDLRKFLGYVVSKKGIEVNPEKVQAVQQMEPPKTAFDELKQYLASAPMLSKPAEGESLCMYLGVTKEAVSSVLLREENKNQKPICYVSKVLQGAEQNYPLAEKAAFALVYTARRLRAYFQSHQIVVYTDLPLRKILQKPELSSRLIGWSVELTIKEEKAPEHLVWVLYVDGAANIEGLGAGAVLLGPDGFKSEHALRFKFQTTNNAAEYEALIYGLKLASELKVQSIQDVNPQRSTIVEVLDAPSYTDFAVECQLLSTNPSTPSWTTPLINYLQSGELPEDLSIAKVIKRRAAHFTLIDNQLYKRAASMPLLRCLTPYEAEYAVREVHEGVCGTHIGGKTLARKLLRHGYYWPTMVEDAQDYVKKCPTCQFNADDIHMPGEMLSSLTSPWPFAQCGVDLLGPFIKGKRGCTFLVVAVDYFTKWIEAKALSTTTERKIEEFLFNSILCRFGIPQRIIADNGPQFRAAALRSFCNDYDIELSLTSATGETPFSLAYGAEAVIPVKVGLPSARSDRYDDQNNGQLLRENLDLVEEVREMARIRNMAHQGRVARFYNKRVRACQFQVGDLVLRKAGLTNTYSHMGKLAPNWEGPYMVA
ncbi:hypothetical protein SLEP1_g14076 [Rubroshorea leprosula]|uniref:Integrase catalytic domain-containing protein n=1 Tax=Rubroshorea leprosula TaxID=152421 RepID=A0AAV5IRY5_9ROSI|nr:hypothetical protein SLEP1_g14076 [Rubroshorea leprosula]